MAKLVLVANWKDRPSSLEEANTLLSRIAKKAALYKGLNFFIAPPLVYFEVVARRVKRFGHLASQDVPLPSARPVTGEITLEILKNFGTRLAIVGHSERRRVGDTDQVVAQKIKMALKAGITPLVCVGELDWDEEGNHFEFLRNQVMRSLEGVPRKDLQKVIIVYEPVWSIGKRAEDALSPANLSEMSIFIKKVLSDAFGREAAEKTAIFYGGSVEPANARALSEVPGIKGFLVGHASLDAKKIQEIAESLI